MSRQTLAGTKWKIQLESREENDRLCALVEIVKTINCAKGDWRNYTNFCEALIKTEMCHYLAKLMLYGQRSTTTLINKIVCHLSEHEAFFRHDFFKILQGYLRLINSFPPKHQAHRLEYRNSIVCSALIILKRARGLGVDFNCERVNAMCLLISACSINDADLNKTLALDYICLVLDIMATIELSEQDRKYQYERIAGMIRKVDFSCDSLSSSELQFLFLSNVLHHTLQILSSSEKNQKSAEEERVISIMTGKVLCVVEFIAETNMSVNNYECFCNLLFYMLSSDNLSDETKLLVLNRFFTLNGYTMLFESIKHDVLPRKSRVLLAEVMYRVTKLFHAENVNGVDLKSTFLDIAANADFDYGFDVEQPSEPSAQTILLSVLRSYIDAKWNKEHRSHKEILSMLAYFLKIVKQRKINFDKGVFVMLISLYSTNLMQIPKSDDYSRTLESSTSTLIKHHSRFIVVNDWSFIQWLFHHCTKASRAEYGERVVHFLRTSREEELNEINHDNLFIFDLKTILNAFHVECASSHHFSHNLAKIIAKFSLGPRDYASLMDLYEQDLSNENRTRSIDLLEILSINANRLSTLRSISKTPTLVFVRKVLNGTRATVREREMAMHLAVVIMNGPPT